MSLKNQLDFANKMIEKQAEKLDKLQDEIQELRHQLRQYETATAAIKWLWVKANEQDPFEI